MIAFNQRMDPNFAEAKAQIKNDKIGRVHTIHIISRDPGPPPVSYIKESGGLIIDMTIHDFDMARYITGREVVEVFAKGYNLIDPEIGKAGDIDTGIVLLSMKDKITHLSSHFDFFMDRYEISYQIEMEAFINSLKNKSLMAINGEDGLKAMLIAHAANISMVQNRN